MLNRKRTLMFFLESAGGEASLVELTKWSFLLKEGSQSKGGPFFYDFVPYKFGPVSFTLSQELEGLSRQGYLEKNELRNRWNLTAVGRIEARKLPPPILQDAKLIHWKHGKRPIDKLIDEIYEKYPWYTVNSERKRMAKRKRGKVLVYTVGYEGETIDRFLNKLLLAGIQRLIDVRSNPVARRYGFHKSTLSRLGEKLAIEYEHFSQLGIVSNLRTHLETQADRERLFHLYRNTILATETATIETVSALVSQKPSVLVCMESEPRACHRTHLAAKVSGRTGLPIEHL